MMLRHSLEMPEAAAAVERAVKEVLQAGYRTEDIRQEGAIVVGTDKMGTLVAERVGAILG